LFATVRFEASGSADPESLGVAFFRSLGRLALTQTAMGGTNIFGSPNNLPGTLVLLIMTKQPAASDSRDVVGHFMDFGA
jgi:hypothetical protein